MSSDPLGRFSALTREWFTGTFAAPTAAQAEAWSAIADGNNTLVVAPTGSGKTLAAFLWAIDRLASSEPRPAPDSCRRPTAANATRVLYVSPLKALAVDVERNLRTPLTGIGRVPERRGAPVPDIAAPNHQTIWPDVEARIVDLVEAHRSAIVFANSRRLAERLTSRLNEIHAERSGIELPGGRNPQVGGGSPAQLMASGQSFGAEPLLARAHHGSVSKEQRALVEDDLKSGRLRAVVATSSLELGIDMGAVDLVIQVEAPPSVASGLQRIGRAGHQVGEISQG